MIKLGRVFHGIIGESTLSEEMNRFSEFAQMKRIDFIKARLIKKTALGAWQPIPIERIIKKLKISYKIANFYLLLTF